MGGCKKLAAAWRVVPLNATTRRDMFFSMAIVLLVLVSMQPETFKHDRT